MLQTTVGMMWAVFSVSAALVASMVSFALAWKHQKAGSAELKRANEPVKLRLGKVSLRGTVRRLSEEASVTLELEQNGVTGSRGSGITWTETKRSVQSNAFALRLDDGSEVTITPTSECIYALELNEHAPEYNANPRTMVGKLEGGDRVTVEGVLREDSSESAYRSIGGWRIDAPNFIGIEAPSVRAFQWARFWLKSGLGWLVATASIVAFSASFVGLAVRGECCEVSVTNLLETPRQDRSRQWTEHGLAGVTTTTCEGEAARTPTMSPVYGVITEAEAARVQPGDRVRFVVLPEAPSTYQLGVHPTLNGALSLVLSAVLVLLALATWLQHRAQRAWYEFAKATHIETPLRSKKKRPW